MALIKAKAQEPAFAVADVVRAAGYSKRHVEIAFKKILNQGIGEALRSERIRRAKTLLLQTNLGVAAIAYESGFRDYANFARMFHEKVGLSCSDFRKKTTLLRELPDSTTPEGSPENAGEWYKESFPGTELGKNWKPKEGQWSNADGCMVGWGDSAVVMFLRPLPENCRIRFDAFLSTGTRLQFPNLRLSLVDQNQSNAYCYFMIATGDREAGEYGLGYDGYGNNPDARIAEGQWHSVSAEVRDDRFCFLIDDKQVFQFRDSFPPAYASRCFLSIETWHCNLRIQRFAIQNLGFAPAMNPIRRGDALYGAGLFENARDFYARVLESGATDDAETMELRYKIGMCFLHGGALTSARGWIEKVVDLREEKFWAQQARLALLELSWKASNLEEMWEHMRLCVSDPETRDRARVLVQHAIRDFEQRGFFVEAVLATETWAQLESPEGYWRVSALLLLSDLLPHVNRFADAEQILKKIRASRFTPACFYARINLMQLYHEWGKIRASEAERELIEKEWHDAYTQTRCRLAQAINLRALERFEQALDCLRETIAINPADIGMRVHAVTHMSFICCCLGRLEEGRKMLKQEAEVNPGFKPGSRHLLPFHLARADYEPAANLLMAEFGNSKVLISSSAELGIKAGILYELASKVKEAKSIFKEVNLRFPEEQVRYFGQMANALFTGEDFVFTEMPYEHFRRSEMFYLIGLLMEKRGDKEAALALFEQSMKDDPALRWPAFFAKQKRDLSGAG